MNFTFNTTNVFTHAKSKKKCRNMPDVFEKQETSENKEGRERKKSEKNDILHTCGE